MITRERSQRGVVRVGALVALLALLLVLGVVVWFAWQTFGVQPQRSIAAMGHAYTSHDWETFESYVDLESVVDAGIEDVVPEQLRGEGVLGRLAEELIEAQRPVLVERARGGLQEAVEQEPEGGETWFRRRRGLLAPLRADVLERTDDEARVRIATGTRWGDVEVRMVPREGRWVVVEVLNLAEMLARGGVR